MFSKPFRTVRIVNIDCSTTEADIVAFFEGHGLNLSSGLSLCPTTVISTAATTLVATASFNSESKAKRALALDGAVLGRRKLSIDKDFLALTVLAAPEKSQLDIIALHGLNGHAFTTWVNQDSENNATWLRDFLSADVPNARILTYGYNSALLGNNTSVSNVRDFAKDLLQRLMDDRSGDKEDQRPIVFICHSLGGIVVKQAVILAHAEQHRYSQTFKVIHSILFLATPHGGSRSADLGALLSIIATLAFQNPAKQLLSTLKFDSDTLLHLAKEFQSLLQGINVMSFYERRKTVGLNALVVDERSSLLGLAHERPIPVDATHSGICKFAGPAHPLFTPVLAQIKLCANAAPRAIAARFDNSNTPVNSTDTVIPPETLKQHFLVDVRQNPQFSGREKELNILDENLTESDSYICSPYPIVAVHGLGGVGKTQLVTEYIYRRKKRQANSLIFWASATGETSLTTYYKSFAQHLAKRESSGQRRRKGDNKKQDEIQQVLDNTANGVEIFKDWLISPGHEGWLLVLDNLDDISFDIGRYLPLGAAGSVIITTRDRRLVDLWQIRGQHHTAQSNEPEFHREYSAIKDIVQELHGFPLALDQAADFVRENAPMTFGEYLEFLAPRSEDRELLLRFKEAHPKYPESIMTTWEISLRDLRETGPTLSLHPLVHEWIRLHLNTEPLLQAKLSIDATLVLYKFFPFEIFAGGDQFAVAYRSRCLESVNEVHSHLHSALLNLNYCRDNRVEVPLESVCLLVTPFLDETSTLRYAYNSEICDVLRWISIESQGEDRFLLNVLSLIVSWLHGQTDWCAAALKVRSALESVALRPCLGMKNAALLVTVVTTLWKFCEVQIKHDEQKLTTETFTLGPSIWGPFTDNSRFNQSKRHGRLELTFCIFTALRNCLIFDPNKSVLDGWMKLYFEYGVASRLTTKSYRKHSQDYFTSSLLSVDLLPLDYCRKAKYLDLCATLQWGQKKPKNLDGIKRLLELALHEAETAMKECESIWAENQSQAEMKRWSGTSYISNSWGRTGEGLVASNYLTTDLMTPIGSVWPMILLVVEAVSHPTMQWITFDGTLKVVRSLTMPERLFSIKIIKRLVEFLEKDQRIIRRGVHLDFITPREIMKSLIKVYENLQEWVPALSLLTMLLSSKDILINYKNNTRKPWEPQREPLDSDSDSLESYKAAYSPVTSEVTSLVEPTGKLHSETYAWSNLRSSFDRLWRLKSVSQKRETPVTGGPGQPDKQVYEKEKGDRLSAFDVDSSDSPAKDLLWWSRLKTCTQQLTMEYESQRRPAFHGGNEAFKTEDYQHDSATQIATQSMYNLHILPHFDCVLDNGTDDLLTSFANILTNSGHMSKQAAGKIHSRVAFIKNAQEPLIKFLGRLSLIFDLAKNFSWAELDAPVNIRRYSEAEMNSLKPIIDSLNSLDHYDLFSEDSVAPDGALNSSEDDEDSDIEMDI
ncbi:hypothetical protein MMC12_008647 [Toensbergia leucococca]|nr:hypothetical protein [Toensbergia leucococca]